MGRHAQPEIREQLLQACTDHALTHGLPDRLAPLATATGTSQRMLIYHFGTRDALLREVLHEARRRQLAAFGDLLRVRPGEAYTVTLLRAWRSISGPKSEPFTRMFGLARHAELQHLWPDFPRTATTDWLGPLRAGLGETDLATLALAVIRGLLLDLEATGERPRADRAFTAFLEALDL